MALYLGGLLGQLLDGYEKWMAEDGISGQATMDAIQISPFFCIPNVLTPSGLKGVFFIAVAGGGIVLYLKLSNRFSSNDFDDRNFVRSKRGTYGTAGWMTRKEMNV